MQMNDGGERMTYENGGMREPSTGKGAYELINGYRIIAEKLDEVGNVVNRREAKGGGYFAAVSLTGMVDGKPAIAAMAEGYMTPDILVSALTNYSKETCTTVAFMLLAHNFADGAPGGQHDARGR